MNDIDKEALTRQKLLGMHLRMPPRQGHAES
ncbi:hypothetical protein Ga0076813_10463 [endosymbiont of Ridgeia piscesae]|jgi:hypothetical protein|uniref:Uncharacterized protein n=1 Tax=endosymbiont of Ridgeia piscesae TaxID=54398 RepID=A0A0T5Z2A5_9GAMM|nr:hypothetical protein Ga0076813_10463 [endosymbiont of Ridgeia piscesae]